MLYFGFMAFHKKRNFVSSVESCFPFFNGLISQMFKLKAHFMSTFKCHFVLLFFFLISSHTGNVRILEVNPDGNYVRVFNTSSFKVSSLVQAQLQNLESYHQNINLIVNSVV